MDLGQRAVSCNHAVGLRAAQMHRVHSVDGPNVRACGVLRDLGFAAKGGTLYSPYLNTKTDNLDLKEYGT